MVRIRDNVVHKGGVYRYNWQELSLASYDLLAMLDRMILAKLGYNGYFNDFHDKDNPQCRLMSKFRENKVTDENA